MSKTGLLIMGSGRSGTSMVTGAIHACGAAVGGPMMKVNTFNPKGFFELCEAFEINERILHQLGQRWNWLAPLPPNWLHSEIAVAGESAIKALIQRQFEGDPAPLWAVKDPRLSRLFPLWYRALADHLPRAVICIRHPAEVIPSFNSLSEDLPSDPIYMLQYWIQSNLMAERATRGVPRYVVSYDDMVSQPERELDKMAEALKISWPRSPATIRDELKAWVDPSLKHFNKKTNQEWNFVFPAWMDLAVQLYEKFQNRDSLNDPAQWAYLDKLWHEIIGVQHQHGEFSAQERLNKQETLQFCLNIELEQLRDILASTKRWSEMSWIRRMFSPHPAKVKLGEYDICRKLVDVRFYLENYPDVKSNGMDPVEHYLKYGWKEGRRPNPTINADQFIKSLPDAGQNGNNPLVRYIMDRGAI